MPKNRHRYNHLLNDLIHFWMRDSGADVATTEQFALKEQMIAESSDDFLAFLDHELKKFKARGRPIHLNKDHKLTFMSSRSASDAPIGSNPFMEFDSDTTSEAHE